MRRLTERRVSVEVSLLESELLEAQRHDVVDSRRADVGHRQSTAEPVEHCTLTAHSALTPAPSTLICTALYRAGDSRMARVNQGSPQVE